MTDLSVVTSSANSVAHDAARPMVGADVDARAESEDALRRSEQRFRAIIQHSRDLIIVCSRDGRILYASSALEAVSGVAPADRVGGSVFERLHPDDAAVARARIGQLVKDASLGVATKLELRLAGADGDWRWIECTAANLLDHPAVEGIVLNCRDVSERKRSEAELAAAEARLDTALRTSRTTYWTIDVVADRGTMSRHFFELTGIDQVEWESERHPWYGRTHPDDYPIVHRAYEDYLAGHGEFYECEYRLRTPSGWLWLHDRGRVAERDASGRPRVIAGTSREAGWRRRMEESLRDAAQEERRRISYELHDGLGQELSGVQFMLTGLARELHRERSPHAAEVDVTLALIGQALATTRSISRGLEPANPKSGGLRAALSQMASDLSQAHGIPVRFDAPALPLEDTPDAVTDNLFRMCREALAYARRQGAANGLGLAAIVTDGELDITITGDSPTPHAPPPDEADAGLRVMAYRAKLIGAQVAVSEAPERGTEVRIRYPLAARHDPRAP
jgi:PAS domain S-box-containing protein